MTKDSGTVNIHGKEYKTVAARVQEFREGTNQTKLAVEAFYKLSIETDIVEANEKLVVMKATIRDRSGFVIATGHAEEVRTSSQINRTSALENAETSAIGRALAAFGLAGTEYASADEVAQAINQQRPATPKPAPATTPQEHVENVMPGGEVITAGEWDDQPVDTPPKGTEATPKQLQYIKGNFAKLGTTDRDEMLAYVTAVIRREVASSKELTKGEAVKVIDKQLADIEERGDAA